MFGSTIQAGGTFSLSSADASFVGETARDWSGSTVAPAGDVDADGLADVLIGALQGGGGDKGKTYLMFGSSLQSGGTFDLASADADFVGEAPSDHSACSVASAGDVEQDGYDDILIGAEENDDGGSDAGKAYLVSGSAILEGGSFILSSAHAAFLGEHASDESGSSVSSAGDVDGDGFPDILIGAKYSDDGGSGAGKAYLLLGASVLAGGLFDLSDADAMFVGEAASDEAGRRVSPAGDVDGDGLADFLIGAIGNDDGGSSAGKAYLLLGASVQYGAAIDLSESDVAFVGEGAVHYSSYSLSSAGDVDGDGLDDILTGAHLGGGGTSSGKAYLMISPF